MDFAGFQLQGTREYQQDDYGVIEGDDATPTVYVLADGMGGHKAGERASQAAILTISCSSRCWGWSASGAKPDRPRWLHLDFLWQRPPIGHRRWRRRNVGRTCLPS